MNIDLSNCFTDTELPLAERILSARSKELNVSHDAMLRPYVRDVVFSAAGRPDELTESVAAAAEERAHNAQEQRNASATNDPEVTFA